MSAKWVGWVLEHSPFEGKQQVIHLVLADHASADGECYPGAARIAEMAHTSMRYVFITITALESAGFLERLAEGGGRGRKTHFRLLTNGEVSSPFQAKGELGFAQTMKDEDFRPLLEPKAEPRRSSSPTLPDHLTVESAFDEWWSYYPRRKNRVAALGAYKSALKHTDAELLLKHLRAFKFSPDQRYIPYASTWLHGRRWEDQPDKPDDPYDAPPVVYT